METVSPIEQALATYNQVIEPDTRPEQAIATWKEEYSQLEIAGVTDTEGYRKVTNAIAKVRAARTSVEKTRKELKADALEFGRRVDARAREITALLEPLEEELKAKKEAIDNEKERIKQEKMLAEQRKLDGRLKQLFDLGAQFNGASYYLGESNTTGLFVKECSDEQFTVLVKSFEASQVKIAEQKEIERQRLEAEEKERQRLAEERRIENERLQNELRKQQEETKRLRREAEEREQEFQRQEQERLRQEQQQKELEARQREQELRDRMRKARIELLKAAGLDVTENIAVKRYKLSGIAYSCELRLLLEMPDELFNEQIEVAKKDIAIFEKAEAVAVENMKSDDEILRGFADEIIAVIIKYRERPDLKSEHSIEMLYRTLLTIENLVKDILYDKDGVQ